MNKFKEGELATHHVLDRKGRVIRTEIVTITRVYSDYSSQFGPYPELYEITHPDGRTTKGWLPHGLGKTGV